MRGETSLQGIYEMFRRNFTLPTLHFLSFRDDNFGECISLGKELLTRSHYASNEIKEKLKELTGLRNTMLHRWEERWEHLQLILEVYQFARDAAVAEAWLIAQDPYLKSEELGVSINHVSSINQVSITSRFQFRY